MPSVHIQPFSTVDWQPSKDFSFALDEHSMDVWHVQVPADISSLKNMLNIPEAEKANRFRNQKSCDQYITGKAALRYLSAKYTGTKMADLVYAESENHKPQWQALHQQLYFNTAHSGDHVLLCFARSEVGVDIEKINPDFLYGEVLERCFCQEEIEMIQKSTNPIDTFYLLWTRKEALVKAMGTGIKDNLPGVPCLAEDKYSATAEWNVKSFPIDDYKAAIAFDAGIRAINCIKMDVPIMTYSFGRHAGK